MPYESAVPVLVDGQRVRVVFYGPDVPKIEDEINGGNVEQWARNRIDELNTPRSKSTIAIGTPLDLTPPAPPEPTLLEVYLNDRSVVLQDAADISAGIYDASDPVAMQHLDAAKASRQAYLGGK